MRDGVKKVMRLPLFRMYSVYSQLVFCFWHNEIFVYSALHTYRMRHIHNYFKEYSRELYVREWLSCCLLLLLTEKIDRHIYYFRCGRREVMHALNHILMKFSQKQRTYVGLRVHNPKTETRRKKISSEQLSWYLFNWHGKESNKHCFQL